MSRETFTISTSDVRRVRPKSEDTNGIRTDENKKNARFNDIPRSNFNAYIRTGSVN